MSSSKADLTRNEGVEGKAISRDDAKPSRKRPAGKGNQPSPKKRKIAPPKSVAQLDEEQQRLDGEEQKDLSKFQRGERINSKGIKDRKLRGKLGKVERLASSAAEEAVKAQVLLTEQAGYLEAEGSMERTADLSQVDLIPHLDLQTAAKMFDLSLEPLGPYSCSYSRNGQHLILCGEKGHVAVLEWQTKRLISEMHLNETCRAAT